MDKNYLKQIQSIIPITSWQISFPVFLIIVVVSFLQRQLLSQAVDIYTNINNGWLLFFLLVLIPISVIIKKLFSQPLNITLKQFLAATSISVYIAAGFLGQIESFNLISHVNFFSLDSISIIISFIISLSIIYQAYKLFWTFATKPELNHILENKLAENVFSLTQIFLLSTMSIALPLVGLWLKFSAISNLNFSIFSIINLQNLF